MPYTNSYSTADSSTISYIPWWGTTATGDYSGISATTTTTAGTNYLSEITGNTYYCGTGTWTSPHEFIRYEPVPPTPAQLAETKRIEAEQALADKKAEKLLVEQLSPENRARFNNKLHIVIPSGLLPDVNYRIKPTRSAKIDVLQGDKVIDNICIMPQYTDERLPEYDVVLAKVLHLQYNEAEAIRVANYAANIRALLNEKTEVVAS